MRSKLQAKLSDFLRFQLDCDFEENIRPKWLATAKDERCELDFYIETYSLAIEVQGIQHYIFTPHFHRTTENFEALKLRDRWKAEVCQAFGIELLYVHSEGDLEKISAFICQHKQKTAKPTLELSDDAIRWLQIVSPRLVNRLRRHTDGLRRMEVRLLSPTISERRATKSRKAQLMHRRAIQQLIRDYSDTFKTARERALSETPNKFQIALKNAIDNKIPI